MKKSKNKQGFFSRIMNAFTLVELVVVVTILGVLSTVGFVSYSSYIVGVRDANRLAALNTISTGLELYSTKFDLPLPDDAVEIYSSGKLIAYQGYAGKNVLQTVDYGKEGKDPKTDEYYSYYVTADQQYFQMLGYLERSYEQESAGVIDNLYAADYDNKYVKVYGRKLGILTDETNTPIHKVEAIRLNGRVDVQTSGDTYVAHFKDKGSFTGSGSDLEILEDLADNGGTPNSCLNWVLVNDSLKNKEGHYNLVDENGERYEGYCDGLGNELITDSEEYEKVSYTYIEEGDFENDLGQATDIPTESGSIDDNTITPDTVPYENDGDDDYEDGSDEDEDGHDGHSLHQEGDDSNYRVEVDVDGDDENDEDDIRDQDIIKMCAWVKNNKRGTYIFNNILEYNDGRKHYNGALKTIRHRYTKGKKWTYQCVERVVLGNPKSFVINLGYRAHGSGKNIRISGFDVEVFRHK